MSELGQVTCALIWKKQLTIKEVDGKLKKATMQQSELELFKEKMHAGNPSRHILSTCAGDIGKEIGRIERMRDGIEVTRKPTLVAQILDGRVKETLIAGLQEMDHFIFEEVLTLLAGKMMDHSPLYMFKFLSLASEGVDGMLTFYELHQACSSTYSMDKFLTVQRNIVLKWFDTLRSIKKIDDISQNLPKNLYQPNLLRTRAGKYVRCPVRYHEPQKGKATTATNGLVYSISCSCCFFG